MSLPFDLSEIIGVFIAEAQEHIENLTEGVLTLEKKPKDLSIIDTLFREAHSLKGASGTVGFTEIRDASHEIEDILSGIRDKSLVFDASVADNLFSGLDIIKNLMEEIAAGGGKNENFPSQDGAQEPTIEPAQAKSDGDENEKKQELEVKQVKQDKKEKREKPKNTKKVKVKVKVKKERKDEPSVEKEKPISSSKPASILEEFVRVPLSRIDSILNLGGALVINKIKSTEKIRSFRKVGDMVKEMDRHLSFLSEQIKSQKNISIPSDLKELLYQSAHDVGKVKEEVDTISEEILGESLHLDPIIDQLQRHIREIRMLPCSTIFSGIPRLVRDIARKQGKEIELIIEGEETELDKKVLEGIKEPLMHILRNSIDHGLETPEERTEQGKPEQGTIRLSAFHKGEHVVIEVQDDGRGLDLERIRSIVLQKKMATAEELEKMDEKDIVNYVFMSGFSTSRFITDVSGRGVGMDVVRSQIESLKGQVVISTQKGIGTMLHLELPLTIAIIHALLLKAGGRTFGIPLSAVEEIARVSLQNIQSVENKKAFQLRDHIVPIVRLDDTIGIPMSSISNKSDATIVIISSLYGRVGFLVDRLLGKEEIYIKNLGSHLGKLKNVSGATMLRTGEIIIILDPVDLVVSSKMGTIRSSFIEEDEETEKRKQKLLVVEDSMTTRELMRPILEGEGYEVETAVDGLDGIEKISLQNFDLIISDVEMPRMNGLEMCRFIRENESYKDIPLVFVTARGSEEEKRRGIEAGAQAYITKGGFDQSNLLTTISRLIV